MSLLMGSLALFTASFEAPLALNILLLVNTGIDQVPMNALDLAATAFAFQNKLTL